MNQSNEAMEVNRSNSEWALPETLQMLVLGGDGDVVAEIIDLFKTDTSRRLDILRQALAKLDVSAVKAQAHAIKGSAVQVGAHSLAALCQRIELESPIQPREELEGLLAKVEADFAGVCRIATVY